LVVFPGESLNLHIFEERYRQLIADAEKDGVTFCVPTVIDSGVRPIATEVQLIKVATRYPSGESDVRTRGARVFYLDDYLKTLPGKLYPGGFCRELDVDFEEDPLLNHDIVTLTRDIYAQLSIEKKVRDVADGFRTYDIAHYVGLTLEQEYELLTLLDAEKRQTFLIAHLENVRPELKRGQAIRERAALNGHFKELVPPEW